MPASGLAVVDKPVGWTSHDVVARTRGILGTRKVGHSGTLDPAASGVLVLGIGRATRLLRFVTELPKSYVGEIVLGTETDSLDAAGQVTARHDMNIEPEAVRAAARRLTGAISQVPPMVSAVRVGGKRLHELARAGLEVPRQARTVQVYRFDIEPLSRDLTVWRAGVECSSGTYVRVLAADLGQALGGGAHLRSLRRDAVGDFVVADAQPVEHPVLLPPAAAVAHLDGVRVSDPVAVEVRHGRKLSSEVLGVAGSGPWAVHDSTGELLAVYKSIVPAGTGPAGTGPAGTGSAGTGSAGRMLKPMLVVAPGIAGS